MAQAPSSSNSQSTTAAPMGGTPSRVASYEAAYFTQYAPSTALDIVRRVPGFQLDLGATQSDLGQVDVRGFAGAAGNVVINGARPSSKAESLEVTLARIPAQRVVRVEVGPGDLYGSEYAGKSQVLNIILSAEGGIDGNVTAAAARRYTGYINTDISGSALIRRGASTFNLSAGTGRNKQLEEGTDTLIDRGDRRAGRVPAQVQQLLQPRSLSVRQLGAGARPDNAYPPQRALVAEPLRPHAAQPRHAGRRASATTA